MPKKLYVGNLNFKSTSDDVRQHFAACGEVDKVNVVMDAYTGRSRGFAFVEMQSEDGAEKARQALNGKPFQDRSLTVDWARPETRGAGNGGGGSSFGAPRRSFNR